MQEAQRKTVRVATDPEIDTSKIERIPGQPHVERERKKEEPRKEERRKVERRAGWKGEVEFAGWEDKGRRKPGGEKRKEERRKFQRRVGLSERRISVPRPGRATDLTKVKERRSLEGVNEGVGTITGGAQRKGLEKTLLPRNVPASRTPELSEDLVNRPKPDGSRGPIQISKPRTERTREGHERLEHDELPVDRLIRKAASAFSSIRNLLPRKTGGNQNS